MGGMDTERECILLGCSIQDGARMAHPCRSRLAFWTAMDSRAFGSGEGRRSCQKGFHGQRARHAHARR